MLVIVVIFLGVRCFEKSCYAFVKCGKTWTENRDVCRVKGGDLLSIETEREWAFINSAIQQMHVCDLDERHIGLTKTKKKGWEWVNGESLGIKKWQPRQPSRDKNFVVMAKTWPPGYRGLFNDLPNWMQRPFICEVPKGRKASKKSVQGNLILLGISFIIKNWIIG